MEGKTPTPVPYKMLLPLSTIYFIEAFVYSNIFSYIGFMVLDFHLTDDPDKVGYYAGYIGSTFSFAGFLSSFWWGRISDRYGRRPVLIFGCAGGMLCTLVFGFSLSLEMAIAARFAAGILNGNVGVCKSYAADILDKTNQVKGVGVLQLGWGLGNVLGPLAGGILSRPCTEYGICSSDSLLGKFPYLLPNVLSCVASIIAIVTLIMYLPKQEKNNKIIELKKIASNEFSIGDDDISINESGIVEEDDESNATLQVKFSREDSKAGLLQMVEEEEDSVKSGAGSPKRFSNWIASKMDKDSIFSNKIAMLNIACYSLLASAFTMFDESFPLFAMSKKSDGGLSASSKDLGIIGSLNGIFTLIVQIFIFYPIASRLKFVRLYRLGLLIAFLLYFNYPTLNLASDNKALLWTFITICTIAKVVAGQFTFSAVTALVSNSCKLTQVGAINGFAQSVVALFRAFSPAVAGNLIAWGFSNKLGFPLNQYLVFIIMSVLMGIAFLITFKFPASLDFPYEEPKREKKEREEEKERMISNEEDERETGERETMNNEENGAIMKGYDNEDEFSVE